MTMLDIVLAAPAQIAPVVTVTAYQEPQPGEEDLYPGEAPYRWIEYSAGGPFGFGIGIEEDGTLFEMSSGAVLTPADLHAMKTVIDYVETLLSLQ